MAIYKRGENWYIDFTFKGQRIRESIGPSRKDAQKVIAKRKTAIVENKFLDIRKEPAPVKFHDFAKEYLQWAKANKKPSTYNRDLYIMRQFDKEFERKTIQEITTWQIEKWKSRRKEGLQAASVNRELALLKHMFSMALKWRRVKENPTKDVRGFKGETKRVRFLMPEEVRKLLSNCGDLLGGLLNPLVTLAVHTGMRKGELLGLEWERVNFEQGIISLFDTKNHERRDIPMDETAKATLRGLERKGDLIFPNKNGKQIDGVPLYFAFHEALKKSGINDFRFHDLRHTFASNLVMEGIDIVTVKELLGHKDLKMTLRYSHLAPSHKAKAVNILDRVMSQNPPQEGKVVQLRG
jgi:site-specific recombinase XerD